MAQHTLTKANFNAMREGLDNEPEATLRSLASGATKLKNATTAERTKRCSQLSDMMGFTISIENFDAAMQFVSFYATQVLAKRPK